MKLLLFANTDWYLFNFRRSLACAGRLAAVARVNAVAGMGYVLIGDLLKARVLRPFVRFLMRAPWAVTAPG